MPPSALQKSIAGFQRTILLTVFVLGLLAILVALAAAPSSELYAPRSLPRVHEGISLEVVIRDLEANDVIPSSTNWESEELRLIPITVSWIWPTDKKALHEIAQAAGIVIDYSPEYHGQIDRPILIRNLGAETPGLYAVKGDYRAGPWPEFEPRLSRH
jgi:hypothetical protein